MHRGDLRASHAIASCAGFGFAARTMARRMAYQLQTIAGRAANASGVASSSGWNRDHQPVSASRNVGMPLSAETPAPVSTVMTSDARSMAAADVSASSS